MDALFSILPALPCVRVDLCPTLEADCIPASAAERCLSQRLILASAGQRWQRRVSVFYSRYGVARSGIVSLPIILEPGPFSFFSTAWRRPVRLQLGSPQTGRGTPFFCFHAAFTEHEKKKKKWPASCGVSDARSSDLEHGCGGPSAGRTSPV